jgi:hypothetical protein
MVKFTFALPNGQFVTLDGPAGSTRAQAEKIYLEQLAAGAFVGLRSGDQLQSVETTTIQFTQSRLDRGTAGVPDTPLLAIYNGGIISSLPVLADVPINNGITVADYVSQSTVTESIGSLSTAQVQAVMASIAASVCQPADVVTNELGVGKYGLSSQQLEDAGYLKRGTTARFSAQPGNTLTDVLKSPSVWTGKDGVSGSNNLLKNSPLQDKIQFGLMKSSYDTLVETGQIVTPGTELQAPTGSVYTAPARGSSLISPTSGLTQSASAGSGLLSSAIGIAGLSVLANRGIADLGGLLATASKFGVDNAVDWAKGLSNPIEGITGSLTNAAGQLTSGLKSQMDSLAKQGQFAVNFSDFKLPAAVAGIVPAAGFTGTIDRSTLNAATAKLIGSDKIALPNFSPQALDTSALTNAASQAQGLLAGGLDASGLLARATGAGGLGSVTASLNGAVSTATSALNSVTGSAAGAVSGALGKLPYAGTDSITLARLGLSPDPLTAIKSRLG